MSTTNYPRNYHYTFTINHSDEHWPASLLGLPFCHTVTWDSVQSPFYPGCFLISGRIIFSRLVDSDTLKSQFKNVAAAYTTTITEPKDNPVIIDLQKVFPSKSVNHMVTSQQVVCTCLLNTISQVYG